MSQTTAMLCQGDERKPGCGERIAMLDRGGVYPLKSAEHLGHDRLGRARLLCVCGAITITKGAPIATR